MTRIPSERPPEITDRLEHLRSQIDAECISYGEIAELQSLAEHIDKDDVQLLEWAGVPEHDEETPECLDGALDECAGPVEYRMALSGTGRSFPRCDRHWELRVQRQEEINTRYGGDFPPADFDPADAGESWDEP